MDSELELEAIPTGDAISSPAGFSASYEDFEQVEQLGSGGNASVYRAFGPDDTEVALKVPHLEGTLSATVLDEFTSEAETWAGIDDHDHVVGILDWGNQPVPWLAMEYMDGGTLRDRIGAVELEEALWIVAVVARTLRHAHRHGVAHLDIKPENILFREMPEGQWDVPKVADWGLAQQLLDFEGEQTGLSLQYAAPEQLGSEGASPDNRTDVYQLGAVAYELFTGQPPFDGDEVGIVDAIRNDEPTPPSKLNPSLPEGLDDVLLSALSKDKEDRYEDVLLFRDAVEELLEVQLGERDTTSELGTATRDSTEGQDAAQEDAKTKGPGEMFCRTCGAIIKEEAEICPECGVRTENAPGGSGAHGHGGAGSSSGGSPTSSGSASRHRGGRRVASVDEFRDEEGTVSFVEALEYPRDTSSFGSNVLAGGVMLLLSFFVVPAFTFVGYYMRVVGTSIDQRRYVPSVKNWGSLTAKGFAGSLILMAFVGVALVGLFVAGALESSILVLFSLVLYLLMYYFGSIALAAYVDTGEIGDVLDPDLLLAVASDTEYLKATGKILGVWTLGIVAMSILYVTVVGNLVTPFLAFYLATAAGRIHGTGYRTAVERVTESPGEQEPEATEGPSAEAEPESEPATV